MQEGPSLSKHKEKEDDVGSGGKGTETERALRKEENGSIRLTGRIQVSFEERSLVRWKTDLASGGGKKGEGKALQGKKVGLSHLPREEKWESCKKRTTGPLKGVSLLREKGGLGKVSAKGTSLSPRWEHNAGVLVPISIPEGGSWGFGGLRRKSRKVCRRENHLYPLKKEGVVPSEGENLPPSRKGLGGGGRALPRE